MILWSANGRAPPGCGVQNGRSASRFRRETHETLDRTRANRKCATVYPERKPACPTCGASAPSKTVLEVDVELQEVLPRTRQGKSAAKPKKSDMERRLREARKSADPWVEILRIEQEHGLPDGWAKQIAGFYGIQPP